MSRVDFGAKPWVFPMPVLILGTYDEKSVANAMNAAWGMISDMNEISISMSEYKTTENFVITGAFTVSMTTEDTVIPCDYMALGAAVGKAYLRLVIENFLTLPLGNDLKS